MDNYNIKEFINNMKGENNNYIIGATGEQIKQLKNLFSSYNLDMVIDFYTRHQPNNIPILKSGVKLLNTEEIIHENLYNEPGRFLSKFGVFVFSITVGGNVVCIDANDVLNGEPSILYADNNFCSYNENFDSIEIGIAPYEVVKELDNSNVLLLNYENITRCLFRFKERFSLFLLNLSKNMYGDIEDYIDCNVYG